MSDDGEGQEAVWLDRLKANAEKASAYEIEFLKWLDKAVPDTEDKLRLPYSSPPSDREEPWKIEGEH